MEKQTKVAKFLHNLFQQRCEAANNLGSLITAANKIRDESVARASQDYDSRVGEIEYQKSNVLSKLSTIDISTFIELLRKKLPNTAVYNETRLTFINDANCHYHTEINQINYKAVSKQLKTLLNSAPFAHALCSYRQIIHVQDNHAKLSIEAMSNVLFQEETGQNKQILADFIEIPETLLQVHGIMSIIDERSVTPWLFFVDYLPRLSPQGEALKSRIMHATDEILDERLTSYQEAHKPALESGK